MSLPDSYTNKNKFQETEIDYSKTTAELARLNKEYEVVFEKVMELEDKL